MYHHQAKDIINSFLKNIITIIYNVCESHVHSFQDYFSKRKTCLLFLGEILRNPDL